MKTNMVKYFWACALVLVACSNEEQSGSRVKASGGEATVETSDLASDATEVGDAEKSLANLPVHEGQLAFERYERRPNGQSFLAYKCTDLSAGGGTYVLRLTRQGGLDLNETLNRRCASYLCYIDSVRRNHVDVYESRSTYQKCGVQGTYTRQ